MIINKSLRIIRSIAIYIYNKNSQNDHHAINMMFIFQKIVVRRCLTNVCSYKELTRARRSGWCVVPQKMRTSGRRGSENADERGKKFADVLYMDGPYGF